MRMTWGAGEMRRVLFFADLAILPKNHLNNVDFLEGVRSMSVTNARKARQLKGLRGVIFPRLRFRLVTTDFYRAVRSISIMELALHWADIKLQVFPRDVGAPHV